MAVIEYPFYKGVAISRDTNIVDGEQVYLGNGQGCGTFWFEDVKEARKFILMFRPVIEVYDTGCVDIVPEKICKRCKGHYSFGSKEWKKAKERACKIFKKNMKLKAKGEKVIDLDEDEENANWLHRKSSSAGSKTG